MRVKVVVRISLERWALAERISMPGHEPAGNPFALKTSPAGSETLWSRTGQLFMRLIGVFLKTLLLESCRSAMTP